MKLSKLFAKEPHITDALQSAGFDDMNKLLNATGVLEDPSELATLLNIDNQRLSTMVGRAALLSMEGMGHVYVDLLAAAGIETKAQLSAYDPFELHEIIKTVAKSTSVGRVPNRATIEHWIEQARL